MSLDHNLRMFEIPTVCISSDMAALKNSDQRIVYLVTYSRADTRKFPTRQAFAEAVLNAWAHNSVRILHWVVSLEAHAETGADTDTESPAMNQHHFHMALKLCKKSRWLQVRNFIDREYGTQVHFSDNHNTYYGAYRYVTKEDGEALHSPQHPDLSSAPRTEPAIASRKRTARGKSRDSTQRGKRRKRALTIFEVSQLIQAKRFTTRLQLVSLAAQQNREGHTALAEFIANRGSKAVDEALSVAKEFAEAEAKLARSNKTRIELLCDMEQRACSDGCGGRWLTAAVEVLESNGILVSSFCSAVYAALKDGRGKYRNVFIHGPANSGKTFILSPLKSIYHAFCNPATGSFAWMGVEEAEIIFLNDFRWSPTTIAWADFLQALEGDTVHLPAPKNFCRRDIELKSDTPFFATADAPPVLIKGGSIDRVNTEMMSVRWRFFNFWRQIPASQQLRLTPCGHCFALLVLQHREA